MSRRRAARSDAPQTGPVGNAEFGEVTFQPRPPGASRSLAVMTTISSISAWFDEESATSAPTFVVYPPMMAHDRSSTRPSRTLKRFAVPSPFGSERGLGAHFSDDPSVSYLALVRPPPASLGDDECHVSRSPSAWSFAITARSLLAFTVGDGADQ